MPDDILDHPELRALLREADSALALVREVGDDDPGNFAAALDQIYIDIGRLLHELVPTPEEFDEDDPTAVGSSPLFFDGPEDEVTQVGHHPDEALIEEDEPTDPRIGRPTDQLRGRATPSGPSRRDAKRRRLLDKQVARAKHRPRPVAADPPLPRARIVTAAGAMDMQADGTMSEAPLTDAGEFQRAPWIDQLGSVMELLALPFDLEDHQELAAEASLVQWSTVDLDARWAPFPPAIQAALLGLLASRARHVQEQLEVDVGPRIALERLSDYRERAGLNKVQGLYAERPPQTASWAEDARQWWETLIDGLREA